MRTSPFFIPGEKPIKSTISDTNGNFQLEGISKGGYALIISFLGYQNYKTEITITNQNVDLGVVILIEGATNLTEVEVTEKIPMATQLGDTTQYNADAFKTLKDASAEELVEKMPGVVIQNGKIQAQGEDVKEVLVDGRPFFGNDPNAALKNLPAEVIDKIQIFDKQSDQAQFSGFDDGETSKTINIITKTDMRIGQFGKYMSGMVMTINTRLVAMPVFSMAINEFQLLHNPTTSISKTFQRKIYWVLSVPEMDGVDVVEEVVAAEEEDVAEEVAREALLMIF